MPITILAIGDVSPAVIVTDLASTFDQNPVRPSTVEKNIFAGDSPTFNFTINSGGQAANLTGCSLSFSAAISPTPASIQIFNVSPTISDPTNASGNGQASVTLSNSQTLQTGLYVAELIVWGLNGAGSKVTALQFPLLINPTETV